MLFHGVAGRFGQTWGILNIVDGSDRKEPARKRLGHYREILGLMLKQRSKFQNCMLDNITAIMKLRFGHHEGRCEADDVTVGGFC